ncbi:MAG TPA: alkaline phosphatase family protein, partial [Flavobacterium sp.]|nr:alkaline phosphatase family protein [Flavobacterium sp.]
MKRTSFLAILCLFMLPCYAQKAAKGTIAETPKLVVGIVIDQMRYDYLYRFADKYGNGGFKRLLKQGFECRNTNYDYVPTYTGPGHAAIYTGTTPYYNGIIGNDWYDKTIGSNVYVTGDENANPVGTESKAGKMSPRRLLTTTMTDELRLSNNKQSKVVGICL